MKICIITRVTCKCGYFHWSECQGDASPLLLRNTGWLFFSTPRVILSDNGAEFRDAVVSDICSQFGIKQTFIAAYHPAPNGLVERANGKILEVLCPIVNELDKWEDWLPHVAASLNSSVSDSTGKSPHYILFGVEKRLLYDLLTSPQQRVYNTDSYTQQQLHVFGKIHSSVRSKLKATKAEMVANQHKRAIPVNFQQGDTVMIQQPEKKSKLSPKFGSLQNRSLCLWK